MSLVGELPFRIADQLEHAFNIGLHSAGIHARQGFNRRFRGPFIFDLGPFCLASFKKKDRFAAKNHNAVRERAVLEVDAINVDTFIDECPIADDLEPGFFVSHPSILSDDSHNGVVDVTSTDASLLAEPQ